jgi:phosphoenolpyruvate-protein phosphotransferase
MLKLTPDDITLSATAIDKADAIRQMAAKMVSDNLVEPDYLQGMLDREQQTSTYLGNGIAIPHGTTDTRHLVRQTGLKVVRFPDGVAWGADQIVYTAIGIAARSDEHLAVLRQLTRVIGDEALSRRLHSVDSVTEVNRILSGESTFGQFLVEADLVRLGSDISSYLEAVAIAGAVLWNKQALRQEELTALYAKPPFHLGDGVWLTALKTQAENGGLAIIQPREPVDLYGDKLRLLLALSTSDTRHLPLLDRLAVLKGQGKLCDLVHSQRSVDIIRLLLVREMQGRQVVCRLPMAHGLHARPAANLAKIAKGFTGEIWIENLDGDSAVVSAHSVTKLISLGAAFGHRLCITMDSPLAEQALSAISLAIAGGLGDPVIPLPMEQVTATVDKQTPQITPAPVEPGEAISGLAGAPGVAIANAFTALEIRYEFKHQSGPADTELARLRLAINSVSSQLQSKLAKTTNTDLAQIISMHMELLLDPEIQQDAAKHIHMGDSAEWGWQQSFEALASMQEKNAELLLAERAIDIRDIGNRVLGELTGTGRSRSMEIEHVFICQEITPSEISECDPNIVKAVVSAGGGVTSHAAILARSLGIPLLVGCGPRVLTIQDGTPLIVNCTTKTVTVAPDAQALEQARSAIETEKRLNEQAWASRMEPAVTTDGHHVEIMANLTAAKGVGSAIESGCEGVGLFRSEFIYMAYPQEPSIEQQQAEYASVLDSLGDDRPLIVRTLDVGGDKPLPYLPMDEEDNPFLGLRGVRLSLRYPDTLKRQLHALLRAADGRHLRIMFPMVTDLQEWRQIRALYAEVAEDYPQTNIDLGIMIEVPSAALMADVFAGELDFFSIGTNDLTQYTLAIDRGHPVLSRQADAISPAVLRLIDMTVRAADTHGIWVGVCGELASDPLGAAILTGLGVRELSMSARAIPRVKAHLRGLSLSEARTLAERALAAESSQAVRNLAGTQQ